MKHTSNIIIKKIRQQKRVHIILNTMQYTSETGIFIDAF